MSAFRKTVLKVGTYHSPEGEVVVTPERLKHWERSVRQIQSAQYQIPVHWNHAELTNVDDLSPIHRLSATPAQAEKTIGRLVDFQVSGDEQSAEIVVETLTQSAREAVESNAVFVSPVVFDAWRDGAGTSYADIIGSVDLVDYPVDHSQGPFHPTVAPALPAVIRMSTQPKQIYRLSTEAPMSTEQPSDSDSPVDTTPESDGTEELSAVPQSNSLLTQVLSGLSELKIVLPSDTDTENLLERLNTALMTAAAQTSEPEPEKENTEVLDPGAPETPAIATMSARVSALESKLIAEGKAGLQKRLDALIESGRCTPAEYDAQKRNFGIQRMSLAKDASLEANDLSKWIECREAVPEGSCLDTKEKIKRLGTASAVPAPQEWKSKHDPSIETQKQQKAQMLGR